jgi:hypothetical protein
MPKIAYDHISVLQAYLRQCLWFVIPITPKEITLVLYSSIALVADFVSAAVQLTGEVYLTLEPMTTE